MGIWDIVLALFTYKLLIILAVIALGVAFYIIAEIIYCIGVAFECAQEKFKKNEK